MRCENKVESWIPCRYDYRKIETRCGSTDPRGDLALCPDCEHKRAEIIARSEYCIGLGFDM